MYSARCRLPPDNKNGPPALGELDQLCFLCAAKFQISLSVRRFRLLSREVMLKAPDRCQLLTAEMLLLPRSGVLNEGERLEALRSASSCALLVCTRRDYLPKIDKNVRGRGAGRSSRVSAPASSERANAPTR